jgi:hypothetical protein
VCLGQAAAWERLAGRVTGVLSVQPLATTQGSAIYGDSRGTMVLYPIVPWGYYIEKAAKMHSRPILWGTIWGTMVRSVTLVDKTFMISHEHTNKQNAEYPGSMPLLSLVLSLHHYRMSLATATRKAVSVQSVHQLEGSGTAQSSAKHRVDVPFPRHQLHVRRPLRPLSCRLRERVQCRCTHVKAVPGGQ